MEKSSKHFETRAIRNQMDRSANKEHSAPIYMTSSFMFENAEEARAMFAEEIGGNIYSRYSNPNTDEFINKLADLEHCEDGIAVASGMSAMFVSLLAFLDSGDHLVASRSVFGSTHQIITKVLPRWGITTTYVDILSDEYRVNPRKAWENAITPKTKMIFCETPSNPTLDIIDLKMLGEIARESKCSFVVDNCFATPYLQNPADFGANLVAHSATKFIDGQGRSIGGAILGDEKHVAKARFFARHSGPSLSPFNGWLLSKSLETLAVRMERHCDNAEAVAAALADHPAVSRVSYPGDSAHPDHEVIRNQMFRGGALVGFELRGGIDAGRNFLDNLNMISLSANLGDSRTIATHPTSTTHSKLSPEDRAQVGITDGFVRISAGLEHSDDIVGDILQSLDAVENGARLT